MALVCRWVFAEAGGLESVIEDSFAWAVMALVCRWVLAEAGMASGRAVITDDAAVLVADVVVAEGNPRSEGKEKGTGVEEGDNAVYVPITKPDSER